MIEGLNLPEAVTRCIGPDAPEQLRVDVARGAIPMVPAARLASLALLLEDPSATVREAARNAWGALPETFLEQALGDPQLPEAVVDVVAALEAARPRLIWRALEHPNLGRQSVERLLVTEDGEILARLARNQRLLQGHPEVARALAENPLVPPAERSRLLSLLPDVEGAPEGTTVEDVPLPPDLPKELLEDDEEEEPRQDAAQSTNLYQLIQSLTVAEKVKLATLGSKGARKLLMRDTNKLVAVAVIRSPKIREDEVLPIAQDRTVHDEILRIILHRKDWLKTYAIRLALCQNPKTPIPQALRLLDTLQERDLRQVSKSRNVPGAVASGALRLLARRHKT